MKNKISLFLILLLLGVLYYIKPVEVHAASITEIVPNRTYKSRMTYDNRNLTYKVVIDKNGFQYFNFKYIPNILNSVDYGFEIEVHDKDRNSIESYSGIEDWFNGGPYGFKKGQVLYITIKEFFEIVDPVNGIDIEFTFHTEKNPYTESENNNNFETADKLVGNVVYRGSTRNALDSDFFKFKVPKEGVTSFVFRKENLYELPDVNDAKDGWTYEIFDKNRNLIFEKKGIVDYSYSPDFRYNKGETIYIKISPTNPRAFPHFTEYTIKVISKGSRLTEAEPNDSFGKANKITKKKVGFLTNEDDVDTYVFKSKKTKKYSFKLGTEDLDGLSYTVRFYKKKKGKPFREEVIGNSKTFNINLKKGTKMWVTVSGSQSLSPVQKDYTLTVK